MTRLLSTMALLFTVACAGSQRKELEGARQVRYSIAEQLAAHGDWDRAFAAADALAREDPGNARFRLLRGVALRHRGLVTEAEADLRMAITAEPRNPASHAELALLLEGVGRSQEALREHREAHRLAPDDARYLNDLGFALTIQGDPGAAVPLLEAALRRDPHNPRFRNNLGFACAAMRDFARASREFALAGPPAQARNNLALAYERAGDLGHAYELYLEAWRIDPKPRFRSNLAHAAEKLARPLPAEVLASDNQKGGT